jgi:lipid A 4'-phosphatase
MGDRLRGITIYAGILAFVLVVFLFVPQIDLAVSRLFYLPGRGFVLADWPPVVFLYRAVPWMTWVIFALAALAGIWLFLMRRPIWLIDGKRLIFLVASVALGSGLLANIVLKDHWGRARPAQIEAFGGPRQFTPAPLMVNECASNCSFVSGHATLGFSFVALAFLLAPGALRRSATAAALAVGFVVGLGRMAQGAHFLSDVVYAALLAYGTTALLYWSIVEHDLLAAPLVVRMGRSLQRAIASGSERGRILFQISAVRVLLATTLSVFLVAVSITFLDRPLALFFHARDPDLRAVFDIIGQLGLSQSYLIVFALAFVALHWGGSTPRLQPFARSMRVFSAIPAFLCISVAASGLIVDVLKFLFGRARPKLLFGESIYYFGGLGMGADHWSFPSGHSATIVALMTALWVLWPQHILFYVLVAAVVSLSRVAVGAHYLSDAMAGALIAMVTTRGVALAFAKSGIDLAAARWGRRGSGEMTPWPCRRFGRRPSNLLRTNPEEAGPVACADHRGCTIGPKADCGSQNGSSSWPCASRPSTIHAAEIPSTRP